MSEPIKLVEAAEWLAENTEDYDRYFEQMAEELRVYPVDERDEFYFQEVEKMGGFKAVLDVVFGEANLVSDDGMEGLEQAAVEQHVQFISRREENGWNPIKSFDKTLPVPTYPEWFRRKVARAELGRIPNEPFDEELKKYRKFLLEITEQEDIQRYC